jgi:hypothetical protein
MLVNYVRSKEPPYIAGYMSFLQITALVSDLRLIDYNSRLRGPAIAKP